MLTIDRRKCILDKLYHDGSVKVNEPLGVADDDVFLLGNGYAPTVTVRDPEGNVVFTNSTPFLPQDNNMTSLGVLKVPDGLAEQVGLVGREDLACKYLSQGQKRRVALARLVKEKRPLWILDEPFVALDLAAVDWLAGIISGHLQRGGLAVMTTHQLVDIPAGTVRELRLS